jgi:argininosuccinate synthase
VALGELHQLLGDLAQSQQCLLDGLARWRTLGDKSNVAWALLQLGKTLATGGDYAGADANPLPASEHTLGFHAGVPVALDGQGLEPVALIEKLEKLAGSYGIGRGIHLGDTVLGTKGRVAFEAPAAVTLITAHRELEKLVLSAQQSRVKDSVAAIYGDLVHEGKQLDLAARDIEALLASSQKRVTGEVSFTLRPGNLFVTGTNSPHSLLAATRGVYGESAGEWTAADTLGYARVLSLSGTLQTRAANPAEGT